MDLIGVSLVYVGGIIIQGILCHLLCLIGFQKCQVNCSSLTVASPPSSKTIITLKLVLLVGSNFSDLRPGRVLILVIFDNSSDNNEEYTYIYT